MNVDISKLEPGVFGVSHGGGLAGDLICHATGSWAGHAFLYLGNGVLVQGQPPKAGIAPADSHSDAIWAWRMWQQLSANGWSSDKVTATQTAVVARGKALIGTPYDWPAYVAFALEVMKLRNEQELAADFNADNMRVCSALVDDAELNSGVPMTFVPGDGPGLTRDESTKAQMPPNLVAPGMLLGLAQRMDWI